MEELDQELAQFSILLPGFRALVDVLEKRANLIHVREALVQFTMCIAWAICRTTIPQVPELAFLKKYLVTTGIAFLDTAEDDVSTTASSDVMVLGANNDRQSSNAPEHTVSQAHEQVDDQRDELQIDHSNADLHRHRSRPGKGSDGFAN